VKARFHRHPHRFLPIIVEGGAVEVYDDGGETTQQRDQRSRSDGLGA